MTGGSTLSILTYSSPVLGRQHNRDIVGFSAYHFRNSPGTGMALTIPFLSTLSMLEKLCIYAIEGKNSKQILESDSWLNTLVKDKSYHLKADMLEIPAEDAWYYLHFIYQNPHPDLFQSEDFKKKLQEKYPDTSLSKICLEKSCRLGNKEALFKAACYSYLGIFGYKNSPVAFRSIQTIADSDSRLAQLAKDFLEANKNPPATFRDYVVATRMSEHLYKETGSTYQKILQTFNRAAELYETQLVANQKTTDDYDDKLRRLSDMNENEETKLQAMIVSMEKIIVQQFKQLAGKNGDVVAVRNGFVSPAIGLQELQEKFSKATSEEEVVSAVSHYAKILRHHNTCIELAQTIDGLLIGYQPPQPTRGRFHTRH